MNLAATEGVAVPEMRTGGGPADFLLFLGNRLVGVIEAKKAGVTLSGVEVKPATTPPRHQRRSGPRCVRYRSFTRARGRRRGSPTASIRSHAPGGPSPFIVPRPCASGSRQSSPVVRTAWERRQRRRSRAACELRSLSIPGACGRRRSAPCRTSRRASAREGLAPSSGLTRSSSTSVPRRCICARDANRCAPEATPNDIRQIKARSGNDLLPPSLHAHRPHRRGPRQSSGLAGSSKPRRSRRTECAG